MHRIKSLFGKCIHKIKENRITVALVGLGVVLAASAAWAIAVPAGGFAQDVYDIAVTQILQGPIGFVAGVAAMVVGAVSAIQQRIMEAIPAILGGAVLMNAETLVTSLGVVV